MKYAKPYLYLISTKTNLLRLFQAKKLDEYLKFQTLFTPYLNKNNLSSTGDSHKNQPYYLIVFSSY